VGSKKFDSIPENCATSQKPKVSSTLLLEFGVKNKTASEIYFNLFYLLDFKLSPYFEYCMLFKVCKSLHHHTTQINQPTRFKNFSSLLLDVYLQLKMLWASSRPSSGAQQLQ
jgi:hypothetical protein